MDVYVRSSDAAAVTVDDLKVNGTVREALKKSNINITEADDIRVNEAPASLDTLLTQDDVVTLVRETEGG